MSSSYSLINRKRAFVSVHRLGLLVAERAKLNWLRAIISPCYTAERTLCELLSARYPLLHLQHLRGIVWKQPALGLSSIPVEDLIRFYDLPSLRIG